MYRNGFDQIDTMLGLLSSAGFVIGCVTNYSYDSIKAKLHEFDYLCQYMALHWISQMNIAYKCISNFKLCIKYNDLKSNPHKIVKDIFVKLSWEHVLNDESVLNNVLL
eukprot:240969_1